MFPVLTYTPPPATAIISFDLSEPATVTLRFQRRASDRWRKVKGVARLADVPTGAAKVVFTGRITAKRQLRPGKHRVIVRAKDAAGNLSAKAKAGFSITQ